MPERPAGASAPVGASATTRAAVVGAAVLVAILAAPIPTHTWQATAVTSVIGLVALAAAVAPRIGRTVRPDGLRPPAGAPGAAGRWRVRSVVPWVLVFAAVAVLELGALAWGDRPQYPTISWLLGPYFTEATVRFGGYVVWICAGFWLVRR